MFINRKGWRGMFNNTKKIVLFYLFLFYSINNSVRSFINYVLISVFSSETLLNAPMF